MPEMTDAFGQALFAVGDVQRAISADVALTQARIDLAHNAAKLHMVYDRMRPVVLAEDQMIRLGRFFVAGSQQSDGFLQLRLGASYDELGLHADEELTSPLATFGHLYPVVLGGYRSELQPDIRGVQQLRSILSVIEHSVEGYSL